MHDRETWLDLFCSRLERGFDVERSAASLGKSKRWGDLAFAEIKRRLGAQAV